MLPGRAVTIPLSAIDKTDCVVIGAGVVGLAIARGLAMSGRDVVVLEAESAIGTHSSSRNSEVIHAGIYYRPGSLKAELCVAGRDKLYEYCVHRQVPFRRTGKLIVASAADDEEKLAALADTAAANGVGDLQWLDRRKLAKREPAILCRSALWSPSTGIVDSHAFMLALRADLEAADGVIACHSPVTAIFVEQHGFAVKTGTSGEFTLYCDRLINAAGLFATHVAETIAGLAAVHVPQAKYAKAHYFTYSGRSPFSTLVYPLPADGGLGIHATLDLGGSIRFGPDVDWVTSIDYRFDESRKDAFVDAIRRYFPDLDPARLHPGYTGIRPKLSGAGQPAADFLIQASDVHGVAGLVNLYGIESPGLTAALAIAERVCQSG